MSQNTVYGRTAKIFVENKQLSLLLVITSFIFGFIAYSATPKQYDPEITLPAYRITTQLPGSTPEEVERLVTNEIESYLSEIPNIDEITSQSLPGGTSIVNVLFTIGSDINDSSIAVSEKIHSRNASLPQGTHESVISQIDPENVPIFTVAFTSDVYGPDGLRTLAYDVREQLKTVPGVSAIEIYGGRSQQINVQLQPRTMGYRNIGVNNVLRAIEGNNAQFVVGSTQHHALSTPIEVLGGVSNANALKQVRVGGTSHSPIYLEDIATISDGVDMTRDQEVTFLEKKLNNDLNPSESSKKEAPAVYISIAKTKGTNITTVTADVREKIDELKSELIPKVVDVTVTRDEGETAREEILTLTEHLALAIVIVTVTLMFFLGLRVALVVATAIPLTLALVFITSYVFDASINRITLFALIFSLGLLVDDAIVVIENIHRHLTMQHKDKTEAIAIATGEVGDGVLLSTLTAVVVFAPMGLVTGMMGAYMGPIAFFAPVARLASLVVAYTLSPYLASMYFHHESNTEHVAHTPTYIARYRIFIEKILSNDLLQKKILISTALFTLVVFSFPFIGLVHFRMLPKADKQQFYVYIDMNEQTPFDRTYQTTGMVKQELLTIAEVTSIESFVGAAPVTDFNGLFRGSSERNLPSQATLKVNLLPKDERDALSEDIVIQTRALLTKKFADNLDVRIKLVEDPPGPPVLATMLVRIKGPDVAVRESITKDIVAQMRSIKGVTDIDTTLPTGVHNEQLIIDRDKVARTGLSVGEVAETLSTYLSSASVGIAHTDTRETTRIVVHTNKDDRKHIDDVLALHIKTQEGTTVPLRSIVTSSIGEVSSPIMHDAREAVTMITAETEGRSVVYTTIDLMRFLYNYSLPEGTGLRTHFNLFGLTFEDQRSNETYRVEWGGEFEMTLENFRDLGMAMLLSYLLIYGILVAQFKSFKSSGLIMTTILLAFAGVLPGFAVLDYFFGMYFSATSMIGAIALGGIVVGNAILLLDFIEQLRERGIEKKDAIANACETRLQPIMLTAVTAVLGAAVIVADPVWSGLAWALIFGLSLSTLLTLVLFPILYFRYGASDAETIAVQKNNAIN